MEIKSGEVLYSWYSKPNHSLNSLKSDSFVPNHVKKNFVENYANRVDSRCSTVALKRAASQQLRKRLERNGFKNIPSLTKAKNKPKRDKDNAVLLELEFVSDRCNRKINKIVEKYDFKIKIASKPAKQLKHCFGGRPDIKKHEHCDICNSLPDRFRREEKF